MHKTKIQNNRGFTLLLAILVAGIVLSVGMSLLNISLKQFRISGIGLDSEQAFQAANAGVECIKYWDAPKHGDIFEVTEDNGNSITCMGQPATRDSSDGAANHADEQNFRFEWSNPNQSGSPDNPVLCTDVSVWKFESNSATDMTSFGFADDCPANIECTIVKSRGYNRPCSDLDSQRVVERELFVRY